LNRIEKFYQIPYFQSLKGLPEKLVEKEEDLGESLGDKFTFSKKEYTNENGKKMILGKINNWYFLGGEDGEFKVFEDKKMILLFVKQEFDKANAERKEEEKLDPSWKVFWSREIETL
jgi:hypothetical protein